MHRSLVAGVLAAALAVSSASPVEASQPYPVPYAFIPSIAAANAAGLEEPPGANRWGCKPTARHPRPVVLVHGTAGDKTANWLTFAPLLANEGYCVFALTYGLDQIGGMGRIQASARELAAFIAKVRKATGARKVDVVGHSQGALMPDYYLKFLGGAQHVRNYVAMSAPWHGTYTDGGVAQLTAGFGLDLVDVFPICKACVQMLAGSPFLAKLRSGGVRVPGIRYTNIVTRFDEIVVPYTSGIEPGMTNYVLQDYCPTDLSDHLSIVASRTAADLTLNALDPRHPRKVRCGLALPALGDLAL
ncbi:MAG TPA: alpha/beta fold hydrolase [Nocardioidaceae bacterium]|nr:alpha/beta fold hydrolase [Nocardioidaceae bacterium]